MTRVVNCQIAAYCIPSLLIFRRYLIGCLNVWMFDRINVLLVISGQIHLYCDRLMTPAALTLFFITLEYCLPQLCVELDKINSS